MFWSTHLERALNRCRPTVQVRYLNDSSKEKIESQTPGLSIQHKTQQTIKIAIFKLDTMTAGFKKNITE